MSKKVDTTDMNQETNRELKPKLRFPEFRDAPEWEVKQLKFVCHMQAGKFVSASEISERYEEGFYPCYGGNGLRGYTKTYTHAGRYPLIGRQGALCGNVNLGIGQFHATEHAVVAIPKNNTDVDWLFYELDLLNLNRFATGQAQPGLSVEVLEKIPIAVPTIDKEQQKIADCLASIDELIAAQSQKIDTFKAHKKGLMQWLFPAEGETLPRLRFAEFRDAPEWEEKQLLNVLDYERPDEYIVVNTNYLQSGVPVLTANKSFILGYTHEEQGVFTNTPVIIFDDFTVDKKYVEFPFKVKSSAIKILKAKDDNNLKFIYEVMNQIKFEAKEHKRYYISAYQNLFVRIPNPDEQQKIANCLSSIDEQIAAQSQKLKALKDHKKGLMQQLFPSPEEVQG